MAVTWDRAVVRANLRLGSGLVMLTYVTMHLMSHVTLLISPEWADATITLMMEPWRTAAGTAVLAAAFLVHYLNALWSIYVRRSLRMPRWERWQLALGLAIPLLLTLHVVGTRVAELVHDYHPFYSSTLLTLWYAAPWAGVLQTVALIVVWVHACLGIHFWLRTKTWYRDWIVAFGVAAVLLPTLALAGFVAAGNDMLREVAMNPDHAMMTRDMSNATPQSMAFVWQTMQIVIGTHIALVALAFGARAARGWLYRRRMPPVLSHASGRKSQLRPRSGCATSEA